MCGVSPELRNLAKIIADWSAPASDFTLYVFGSRVRGSHHSNSDVDLYCKLPSKPTHKSTSWWTQQNSENFNSLQQVLPGPIKWLEGYAPLSAQVEQGKVVHHDRNVVCIWLPPKQAS